MDPDRLESRFLKAMLHARISDEAEQAVRRQGRAEFQLSSQGHEALAAAAIAMGQDDWLHPHYRDRPLVLARGLTDYEIFLDFFGKAAGPGGGRQMPVHYNSRKLRIVSLSTPVATNMLQAVGMAMSIVDRGGTDAVIATLGDASSREGEVYEAIAQAAVDMLPVVFLIEDNGYGISTLTGGKTFWTMPNSLAVAAGGQRYFHGCRTNLINGLDPEEVYRATQEALARARAGQGPTCLVARVERLMSHSSSDDQTLYRSAEELTAIAARDPVKLYEARCLEMGVVSVSELAEIKQDLTRLVRESMEKAEASADPGQSAAFGTLAPLPETLSRNERDLPGPLARPGGGLTMAQCVDLVMEDEMQHSPRIFLYGEDIEDPKGDVFGMTRGFTAKFPHHVRNSPLAEATILGTAVGRALMGDLPIALIQFVDFMGPAMNQLFNEVTTIYWRSRGQWNCPLIIMSPYGAYLPGLGPWHSQTNEAIFAHMPGINVVIPSNPGDAAGLFRFALRCNQPVLFLYPKKLLHSAEGTVEAPSASCIVPFGQARIARTGTDITIVTWGNCVSLCMSAAETLREQNINAEIIDLRTIVPWDKKKIAESVNRTGRLLVAHEDALTAGFGGEIIAAVTEQCFLSLKSPPARIAKADTHNPFNFKLELGILPSAEAIARRALELCATHENRLTQPSQRTAPPVQPQAPMIRPVEDTTLCDVYVPRLAPADHDVVLVSYRVGPGDSIRTGDVIAELESNKGVFELESQMDGVIESLTANPGERLLVGSSLMKIHTTSPGPAKPPGDHQPERKIQLPAAQIQVGALAVQSFREIPQVSVEADADVSSLVEDRRKLEASANGRLLPTYTQLFFFALVRAMMREESAFFRGTLSGDGRSLLVKESVNIGFAATGPDNTLYAPVILDAQTLNLAELCSRMRELTKQVREGTLPAQALAGATMTLSNLGSHNVTGGTPFVIPGQTGVLCTGAIRSKFVAEDHKPKERFIVQMRLVFDHRAVNGSQAAAFLDVMRQCLKDIRLEQWSASRG